MGVVGMCRSKVGLEQIANSCPFRVHTCPLCLSFLFLLFFSQVLFLPFVVFLLQKFGIGTALMNVRVGPPQPPSLPRPQPQPQPQSQPPSQAESLERETRQHGSAQAEARVEARTKIVKVDMDTDDRPPLLSQRHIGVGVVGQTGRRARQRNMTSIEQAVTVAVSGTKPFDFFSNQSSELDRRDEDALSLVMAQLRDMSESWTM